MALQSSGAISINDIAAEFDCAKNLLACAQAAGLSTSNIKLSDFYGLSAVTHQLSIANLGGIFNGRGYDLESVYADKGNITPNALEGCSLTQFITNSLGTFSVVCEPRLHVGRTLQFTAPTWSHAPLTAVGLASNVGSPAREAVGFIFQEPNGGSTTGWDWMNSNVGQTVDIQLTFLD